MLKQQQWRFKIRPRASEGWTWERYFVPIDYLDESDATEEIKKYYYSAMESELKAFKAKRFVSKNPHFCLRLKWLNAMFPDAYYILIWRDPRAVVNSLYQKMHEEWNKPLIIDFVNNYQGWKSIKEKFGNNESDMQTCINYYNHYKETMLNDLPIVKNRIIEIKYESFVKAPREELKRLYDFVGLNWYDKLEKHVPLILEQENNEKWKMLPTNEIEMLEKAFPTYN